LTGLGRAVTHLCLLDDLEAAQQAAGLVFPKGKHDVNGRISRADRRRSWACRPALGQE
jgi:hypothetical protein